MFKIILQRQKCIGCGVCSAVCPDFFSIAQDGKSTLKGGQENVDNQELEVENIACLKEASEVCPAQCIAVK